MKIEERPVGNCTVHCIVVLSSLLHDSDIFHLPSSSSFHCLSAMISFLPLTSWLICLPACVGGLVRGRVCAFSSFSSYERDMVLLLEIFFFAFLDLSALFKSRFLPSANTALTHALHACVDFLSSGMDKDTFSLSSSSSSSRV